MDQRTIFQDFRQLQDLLTSLIGTQASFIVDDGGLTRLNGTIAAVAPAEDPRQTTLVVDSATLHLEQVIAVNGTFRWDYTEC